MGLSVDTSFLLWLNLFLINELGHVFQSKTLPRPPYPLSVSLSKKKKNSKKKQNLKTHKNENKNKIPKCKYLSQ